MNNPLLLPLLGKIYQAELLKDAHENQIAKGLEVKRLLTARRILTLAVALGILALLLGMWFWLA